MAKFTLSIDTGNSAFDPVGSEIARILREAARTLDGVSDLLGGEVATLHDINGNFCGQWRVKGKHKGEG